MEKKIKNIIFDFNGTLLDDAIVVVDAFNLLCERKGLKKTDLKEYLENFGFPVINYYKLHGFTDSDFYDVANDFRIYYTTHWKEKAKLFPHVIEVLTELKNRGYNIYVLSASQQDILDNQLKDLKLFPLFTKIIGANNNNGESKISYGISFIENEKLNRDETIMIGDTYHDHEVAEALGIKTLLSTQGHCSRKRLESYGCELFDDFNELLEKFK